MLEWQSATLQEIFTMDGLQLPEYLKGKSPEEAVEIINEKKEKDTE
jgi:hypothetical protein